MPKSTEKNYTWTNATSATATIVVSQAFIEKVWKQFVLLSYTLTFFSFETVSIAVVRSAMSHNFSLLYKYIYINPSILFHLFLSGAG